MESPPVSQAEIDARIHHHIDELLESWWAEQGASKPKDLELIASVIPFPRNQANSRAGSLLSCATPRGRFGRVDVLLRDADQVIVRALKSIDHAGR